MVISGRTAGASRPADAHHDDVLDRLHPLEGEDDPPRRVRLEQSRLDLLRGDDENVLDLARVGVDDEVLDHPEDLAVLCHDGLASKLCSEFLHPITSLLTLGRHPSQAYLRLVAA